MRRRFSVALGFSLGLGTASLLTPNFYAGLTPNAIASLSIPVAPAIPFTTGQLPKEQLASCSLSNSLQQTSLLRHVPNLPKSLNWYGITQNSAIANAPQSAAPLQPQVHWNIAPPAQLSATSSCATDQPLALSPRTSDRQGGHRLPFQLLNQRAHFILSLASLKQKSDWMLQPLPNPPQPIHSLWREHYTSSASNIASATSAQALPQQMARAINRALQTDFDIQD